MAARTRAWPCASQGRRVLQGQRRRRRRPAPRRSSGAHLQRSCHLPQRRRVQRPRIPPALRVRHARRAIPARDAVRDGGLLARWGRRRRAAEARGREERVERGALVAGRRPLKVSGVLPGCGWVRGGRRRVDAARAAGTWGRPRGCGSVGSEDRRVTSANRPPARVPTRPVRAPWRPALPLTSTWPPWQ